MGDSDRETDRAMATRTKGYPAIPAKIWLRLREKFYTSPPKGDVTAAYLATALGLGAKVAANVMPAIKQVGLVDEENRMTPLAGRWRDAATYAEACREIINTVYPDGLKDVSPPDAPDLDAAQRWFMNETSSGAPRAKQLASFYVMVAKADLAAASERVGRRETAGAAPAASSRPARSTAPSTNGKGSAPTPRKGEDRSDGTEDRLPALPSLSVAIQIYVDKDMTADQVDHAFAAMASHLYRRGLPDGRCRARRGPQGRAGHRAVHGDHPVPEGGATASGCA